MFDELTEKLESVFKKLRGQGKLSEANIRNALRDIRRALLEADVNFKVAKRLITNVEAKALGTEVLASLTPANMIVKIVHDELVSLLGGTITPFNVIRVPEIIMVCGLQGSGKTTSVAKLAYYLKKRGGKSLLTSVDVYRPAALEQLRYLSEKNDFSFTVPQSFPHTPKNIVSHALNELKINRYDVLIVDSAGRLHIDEAMMSELSDVKECLKPDTILFVADGMTGQDAVNAIEGFRKYLDFDGVILTKVDGDARGGAALSIREVTGKPIFFIGTGERIEAFDQFHPDRFASRILGMGDIVTLVEKTQELIDEKEALKLQKKIMNEGLNLEDFLDQLQQLKKMGPLDQVLGLIPGFGKVVKQFSIQDDMKLARVEAVILSMTKEERRKPSIIDGSRRRRIAHGSGTSVQDVNTVLNQFHTMQKMMRKMSRLSGPMKLFRNMKVPL